jgi:hypothetical protein
MPLPSPITAGGVFSAQAVLALNALIAGPFVTQGNVWWVKPFTGSDQNDGKSAASAFKTLLFALAAATANQNDIVLFCAEGSTIANTTDFQSATLDWNKDLVHLIGVNNQASSSFSRVAFLSTYATASNLFTLSGNGCLISGVEFSEGVTSTAPTGCFLVTGSRNHIVNCHIQMAAAANAIAGSYQIKLSGCSDNVFEDCLIGNDTITQGAAANALLQLDGTAASSRNEFRRCSWFMKTSSATNTVFMRVPATSMAGFLLFRDNVFMNSIDAASPSTQLTQAAVIVASGGSVILAGYTSMIGATDWNATDAGNVYGAGYTVTAASFGLGAAVTR